METHPKPARFGVAYLARHAEGLDAMREFRDSYIRHAPGLAHDLIIIYKGYKSPQDLQAAQAMFASLPHIPFKVTDEGFDIAAYLKTAHTFDYDYFCFLNTYTRIIAPGWLGLLGGCVTRPGVGIAGAMASYESISDSWSLINKVIWLCNEKRVSYDKAIAHYYEYVVEKHCRKWSKKGRRENLFGRVMLAASLGMARLPPRTRWQDIPTLDYQRKWLELKRPGGDYFEHGQFPAFPNPHIRSNGYIVARRHLLKRNPDDIKSKLDACRFESGADSLTNQILRAGLRAMVVTRQGECFEAADWPRSRTFRLGAQEGLILTDNQSRIFDRMPAGTRATHVRASWGDYLGPPPRDFPDLGFKFPTLPGGALPPVPPTPHAPIWTSYVPPRNNSSAKPGVEGLKFSFLIPTKNRLALLKHAVDSILLQHYANFEIVISDNASDEDYAAYVKELGDSRVLYEKTPTAVSVTENWDRALQRATGDYILMLGDDDALAPGFIPCVSELIRRHQRPDILYSAAYHYGYPNVVPSEPLGYLAEVRNSVFFKDRREPFLLPIAEARQVARSVGDMRYLFGFNSQHFLFRADFLKSIKLIGGSSAKSAPQSAFPSIFQSPFPDFFAAIVTFMNAQSVLVAPDPLVIIGISPKSFGYYYFNDQLKDGYKFLDNEQVSPEVRNSLRDVLLPGDQLNSLWLIAAESARRALDTSLNLNVNIERYRLLQIVAFLRGIYLKKLRTTDEAPAFLSVLAEGERMVFCALQTAIEATSLAGNDNVIRVFEAMDRQLAQYCPAQVTMIDIGPHENMGHALQGLTQRYALQPQA